MFGRTSGLFVCEVGGELGWIYVGEVGVEQGIDFVSIVLPNTMSLFEFSVYLAPLQL